MHLELALDLSAMEYIQVLRRFYATRRLTALMLVLSDNGTQFVGADRELKEMIRGWDVKMLREFCAEKEMKWQFITPTAPRQSGCTESLVKSCKIAIKKAIGDQTPTSFELYICLQEAANHVNQRRPIGQIPNDRNDGSYICPNDILLGRSRALSRVPKGPFREIKYPE